MSRAPHCSQLCPHQFRALLKGFYSVTKSFHCYIFTCHIFQPQLSSKVELHLLRCCTRSHMTEAGGSCPRSCSGLPVWGHCTPPLKELSHKQTAGVSSSRASVSPHSIQQRLKGGWRVNLQSGRGAFCPMQGVPEHSQQLSQSSGALWMSLSLPSSLSTVDCVVLPVNVPWAPSPNSSAPSPSPELPQTCWCRHSCHWLLCCVPVPFTVAVFHPRGSCVPVLRTEMMIYDCRVFH